MHSWPLRKDTHVHIYTQACTYTLTGVGHRSLTEGCSLAEWSAALPDLHVKQAALTPPLLHPPLFLMSSSSLHQPPPPPSQSFLLFPPQSFSGLVWCLGVTAAFLTFSLQKHLHYSPHSEWMLTQTKKAQCAVYSSSHSAFRLAWASACWAYAPRHHNNHNKHNKRGI